MGSAPAWVARDRGRQCEPVAVSCADLSWTPGNVSRRVAAAEHPAPAAVATASHPTVDVGHQVHAFIGLAPSLPTPPLEPPLSRQESTKLLVPAQPPTHP